MLPPGQLILRQRIGSASCRTDTALRQVQVQNRFRARYQVRRMEGLVKVVRGEVARGEIEERLAGEAKALAPLADFDPAGIGMIAVFLRHNVRNIETRDGVLVEADFG